MSVEQRSLPRRRSAEPAMAALGKFVSMSCTVTDISMRGARLSFGFAVALPPRFDLALTRTGELLDVRLAWQSGREAGVQFGPTISERLADFVSRLPSPVLATRTRVSQARTRWLSPRP